MQQVLGLESRRGAGYKLKRKEIQQHGSAIARRVALAFGERPLSRSSGATRTWTWIGADTCACAQQWICSTSRKGFACVRACMCVCVCVSLEKGPTRTAHLCAGSAVGWSQQHLHTMRSGKGGSEKEQLCSCRACRLLHFRLRLRVNVRNQRHELQWNTRNSTRTAAFPPTQQPLALRSASRASFQFHRVTLSL